MKPVLSADHVASSPTAPSRKLGSFVAGALSGAVASPIGPPSHIPPLSALSSASISNEFLRHVFNVDHSFLI
ncbi:unnamed protein product [Heligmosomoides polygyrus]|uniref:Secreted protein n=1 Tax=Heligmosomoides polygyrus TaxID=6339 RepID=A0A183GR07_HELPZ|nr:unnamed protein product [Heligmosomoides polygyrus]